MLLNISTRCTVRIGSLFSSKVSEDGGLDKNYFKFNGINEEYTYLELINSVLYNLSFLYFLSSSFSCSIMGSGLNLTYYSSFYSTLSFPFVFSFSTILTRSLRNGRSFYRKLLFLDSFLTLSIKIRSSRESSRMPDDE